MKHMYRPGRDKLEPNRALRGLCQLWKRSRLPAPPSSPLGIQCSTHPSQAPSQCPRTGLTGFSAQDRAASPLTHPSVCASAPALHWHSSPRTFGGLAAAVGSVSWPSRPLGSMWEGGGRGARLRGLQTSSGISCDLSLTLSLAAPFFPKQSPVSSHTSPANQRGILFLLYSSQTKTLF